MSSWVGERYFHKNLEINYRFKSKLHEEKSKYQKIEVYDTHALGKLLLLDGKGMLSDRDEFIYHEVTTHVPAMCLKNFERVLIIGGGDGGCVRELVRYPELKEIHLVEIDERVTEVCKEFFPEVTSGFLDSRVKIFHEDGIEFIESVEEKYDLIIIDSTDPEDFAEGLFTKEFYSKVKAGLTDEGIMVNQTENPLIDEYGIGSIYQNLKDNFEKVSAYKAPMLVYPSVYWTFGLSSSVHSGRVLNEERITFMENLQKSLKWYNMEWHKASFIHSNFVKKQIYGKL